MHVERDIRGFCSICHDVYAPEPGQFGTAPIVMESTQVGDYEDSFDKPGSSYLWVGRRHHLDRDEVAELVRFMQMWLDNKCLPRDEIVVDDAL